MWLSSRPNVTPSRARAWYTHVMAESVKRRIRFFTGHVSRRALEPTAVLRLEHHHRIQTELSKLVERHRTSETLSSEDFVSFVLNAESVHIVTVEENYGAMRAKGDYAAADIVLHEWQSIPHLRRSEIWKKMLRGKVANAAAFAPSAAQPAVPADGHAPGH